jgi:hypothetical protein
VAIPGTNRKNSPRRSGFAFGLFPVKRCQQHLCCIILQHMLQNETQETQQAS